MQLQTFDHLFVSLFQLVLQKETFPKDMNQLIHHNYHYYYLILKKYSCIFLNVVDGNVPHRLWIHHQSILSIDY